MTHLTLFCPWGNVITKEGPEKKAYCSLWLHKENSPPCLPRSFPLWPHKEENVLKLHEWLIVDYTTSSFNTGPHQKLLLMSSSQSLRLLMKPHAKPLLIYMAGSIPVIWLCRLIRPREGLDAWGLKWLPEKNFFHLVIQDAFCSQDGWLSREESLPEICQ